MHLHQDPWFGGRAPTLPTCDLQCVSEQDPDFTATSTGLQLGRTKSPEPGRAELVGRYLRRAGGEEGRTSAEHVSALPSLRTGPAAWAPQKLQLKRRLGWDLLGISTCEGKGAEQDPAKGEAKCKAGLTRPLEGLEPRRWEPLYTPPQPWANGERA